MMTNEAYFAREADPNLEDAFDCPACDGFEDCTLCCGTGIVTKLEGERWRGDYYPKEPTT